jgi:hypothetical protein
MTPAPWACRLPGAGMTPGPWVCRPSGAATHGHSEASAALTGSPPLAALNVSGRSPVIWGEDRETDERYSSSHYGPGDGTLPI